MREDKLNTEQQFETLLKVLDAGWIKDWSLAVDGGANVGQWTAEMAKHFRTVHAFEPAPGTVAKLRRHVGDLPNVFIHDVGLLDRRCWIEVRNPPKKPKHRSTYVAESAAGTILAITLDSLKLPSCGLLKLDLEGAEHDALLGGMKLVRRYRPVLIIELDGHGSGNGFKHSNAETIALLDSLGYRLVLDRGPDRVFLPAEIQS